MDAYFPLLDEIEDEIGRVEDRLLGKGGVININRLLALKRSLVRIRRAVSPQREVFNQLTRHDFPCIRPEYLVYFRDVYDHLIRIVEELDSLRDILSSGMDVYSGFHVQSTKRNDEAPYGLGHDIYRHYSHCGNLWHELQIHA